MKNPFYDESFIRKLSIFSKGKIYTIYPLPIISKGLIIKRAYSLPYGFYGGFIDSVDNQFLKLISKKFLRLFIYDFENKIDVSFLNKKEVFTYILQIPESLEDLHKNMKKSRYRSIKKLINKQKKLGIEVVEGFELFDKFYISYANLYSRYHKIYKKENILLLKDYLRLLNVVLGNTYLGGILILKLKNYALLWLSGYYEFESFSIGEFLFYISAKWAIENKIEFLDFGLETTSSVGYIKSSFGTIKYRYNVYFKI
ncbi:MAG: GNAT family N-acetyltransferase [candidate division WOR-3 bacterium]|nr:GNAT family N-acetyltransferase [candidate division WOR-3 bacterium]MCX7947419.1 GNAT family N-acetyltransferase [candidate division WOR-3 bacterium]MDW8151183.1 GNAT family N-acetyltransferase [candidate division WOR-3 bacterium]